MSSQVQSIRADRDPDSSDMESRFTLTITLLHEDDPERYVFNVVVTRPGADLTAGHAWLLHLVPARGAEDVEIMARSTRDEDTELSALQAAIAAAVEDIG